MVEEGELASLRRAVPHVEHAIASEPWAITDEGMHRILAIALRQNEASPQALEAYRSARLKDAESLSIDRGVAQIAVRGVLVRYADMFSAISGATTYQGTALDLERAKADPAVKAIILNIDSPGGMMNGVNELAAAVRATAEVKPVYAYVGNQAASAAYWLAAASSRIVVDETATLGSIGVIFGIRDASDRDAKSGVKTIEFVSSQSPHKRPDLKTEPGRAKVQETVDSLASVFIGNVAKYRGVSEDDVVSKFGGGGVKVGSDAVASGMADEIGSFEGVKARLIAGQGVRTKSSGVFKMSGVQANVTGQAPTAGTEPIHTQAALDAAVRQARTEGETIGAQQAQTRISAILGSEDAKDRPALAGHFAFKTTMSAEDSLTALKASAKEVVALPPPSQNAGIRSRDAAGGLAVADATTSRAEAMEREANKPSPVAIDSRAIYAKFGGKT